MIQIDGSEAGGQILRTALALSILTQKPFTMTNIRAKREKPGIKEQHLQIIKAIEDLTDSKIKGNKLRSTEVVFTPSKIKKNNITVNISTAGSTGLVLQSLLIIGTKNNLEITIQGGATYGKWAPPISFLQNILLPLLSKMNYNPKIEIIKEGFFPKGGALVKATTFPSKLKPLNITENKKIKEIDILSVSSSSLRTVAERQAQKAETLIEEHFKIKPLTEIKYVPSLNPGSGIQLTIKTENSFKGSNSLGEIRKTSEKVAEEAVNNLIKENQPIDHKTADQLLPYLALSSGKIKTSKISNHIKTNIKLIEQFLPVKFKINKNLISSN
ncbi:RNA 3'-phosphate cyclase [archaeon]|nr:RNA 3'-phosphate cyclase [archaeon]|tara:strand:+ start:2026 stop:3009 length:984 start_codon:yes stop_codon:yes gene_type:complete